MSFADQLRIARERAHLTQAELANMLQLPEHTILHWEQGAYQPPVQILPQLLDCLHITLEELAAQPEPAESPAAYIPQPTPRQKFLSVKQIRIWKAVGLFLFIANFFTLFGALNSVAALSARNYLFVENMWVFFLFAPIPLASIIVGIFMLRRGLHGVKNIVSGGIFLVLLCLYGSFTFIFSAVNLTAGQTPAEQTITNTQRLQQAEDILGWDFPEPEQINSDSFTSYFPGEEGLNCTNVYFDEDAMHEFEAQLVGNDLWNTTIPTVLKGFYPSTYSFRASTTYTLLYNVDLDQFNTVPEQGGKYHYLCICYTADADHMQIYEYDLRYIPQT